MVDARMKKAVENAEFAVWSEVAALFPEIKTGDFPIDAAFELTEALEDAIKLWVKTNASEGNNE